MFARSAFALVALATFTAAGFAGPLAPPAGPIGSTGKTLTEVEPRIAISLVSTPGDADSVYRITQPGSYYLTGNVSTATAKAAIEVAASNVTIDLMGFTISGATVTGDYDGIRAPSAVSGITIRNGVIDRTGDDGIDLTSSSVCTIENMRVTNAGTRGLSLGARSVVRECSVNASNSHCIWIGADSRVENSSACDSVTASGIITNSTGTRISGCVANSNAMSGISLNFYDTVEDCRCDSNTLNGIVMSAGCIVRNNGVSQNSAVGILVDGAGVNHIIGNRVNSNGGGGATGAGIRVTATSGTNNNIEDNTVIQNPRGIDLLVGFNLVRRNWVSANTINFNFVAGNRVAPIVVAPSSGANTAAGLGTTDPNANISY